MHLNTFVNNSVFSVSMLLIKVRKKHTHLFPTVNYQLVIMFVKFV